RGVGVAGTTRDGGNPLGLVGTVPPPILVVFSALLLAAALEAGAAAVEVEPPELVELPQAAIRSVAASPAGASHVLFIACPVQVGGRFLTLINVAARVFVHVPDWGVLPVS